MDSSFGFTSSKSKGLIQASVFGLRNSAKSAIQFSETRPPLNAVKLRRNFLSLKRPFFKKWSTAPEIDSFNDWVQGMACVKGDGYRSLGFKVQVTVVELSDVSFTLVRNGPFMGIFLTDFGSRFGPKIRIRKKSTNVFVSAELLPMRMQKNLLRI